MDDWLYQEKYSSRLSIYPKKKHGNRKLDDHEIVVVVVVSDDHESIVDDFYFLVWTCVWVCSVVFNDFTQPKGIGQNVVFSLAGTSRRFLLWNASKNHLAHAISTAIVVWTINVWVVLRGCPIPFHGGHRKFLESGRFDLCIHSRD
jgi:hypothetical protein